MNRLAKFLIAGSLLPWSLLAAPPKPNIVLIVAGDLGETNNLNESQPQTSRKLSGELDAARTKRATGQGARQGRGG